MELGEKHHLTCMAHNGVILNVVGVIDIAGILDVSGLQETTRKTLGQIVVELTGKGFTETLRHQMVTPW